MMFMCNESGFIIYSLQEGRYLLHVAASNGQADIVDILVSHGADVDSVRNSTSYYNRLQAFLCYWIVV